MLPILILLIGLIQLVLFIIVLVKLFNEKGALHGFLGLICGIYTFIWGWMNAGRLGIKNIMIAWTVLMIVGIVLNVMSMPSQNYNPTGLPQTQQVQ